MNINITPEAASALQELQIQQVEIVLQRSGCSSPDFVLNDGAFAARDILLLCSLDGVSFVTDPSNEGLCDFITIDWIAGADGGFTVSVPESGREEGQSGCGCGHDNRNGNGCGGCCSQ